MNRYMGRLSVVAGIFILSLGVGVLVTQEGGRVPLLPDQAAATAGVYEFAWAPDGKSIAYVSAQSGNSEIWVVPAGGGSSKRITSTASTKKQPAWSRDGQWIAYVAIHEAGRGDIQLVSADGQTTVDITDTPADERHPAWSPDSREIAFTENAAGQARIVIADVESRRVRPVADQAASSLQWSPDGQSLLFVSDPLLSNDDRRDNEDIFIVSPDGTVPRLLTPGTPRFREFAPSWAPDSRQLVFASDNSGFSNIYLLDMQKSARRPLVQAMSDVIVPKWSPDGNNIAYIQNEDSQFNIWVIPAQGGRPIRISDRDGINGGFEIEDATPQGMYQWSPDGKKIAFTHSDPGKTSDLWVASIDAPHPLQLTNSMPADLRREARFVWPDKTTYRSFDGTEISALVYRPRGAKPKTGHPALLMFRDTVDGQLAAAWDPFIQFFVSDGYVVFAPNVRGSTGRGKKFQQLVFERGGDHDVRDAFFGLDKLSSEGLIDAQRLGVFGAGTGGFLATAALIKDEGRFKAAVCLYGIVDAVTAASYDNMEDWTRYLIGSTPLTNPLAFYERSLVNFVDKLRTPIVFLYAGDNRFAPFQQLQQFAVQAEVKGKWFDYRIFENESEGWQYWSPNNLRLTLEAMDALFEKHLLGRDREIRLSRSR
jgi:dipeptidyl aminopeptidase/acylaminoacyl peptidase